MGAGPTVFAPPANPLEIFGIKDAGILNGITDAGRVIDKLKTFLKIDESDNLEDYKSKITNYTYAWSLVVKLKIHNDEKARESGTINHIDQKRKLNAHIIPLKCTHDGNLPEVQLIFTAEDEDSAPSLLDLTAIGLQDFQKLVDTQHIDDKDLAYYSSAEVGKEIGLKAFGTSLPPAQVAWNDVESDDTLLKVVFSGVGQVFLAKYSSQTHSRKFFYFILSFYP